MSPTKQNQETVGSIDMNSVEKMETPYWTITYTYPKDQLKKAIEGINMSSAKVQKSNHKK